VWTWSEEHVVAAKKNRTKGRKEEKEKEERGKRKKEPVKGPLPPHDDVIGGTPAHRERERDSEKQKKTSAWRMLGFVLCNALGRAGKHALKGTQAGGHALKGIRVFM
jgi:hypothetical protein